MCRRPTARSGTDRVGSRSSRHLNRPTIAWPHCPSNHPTIATIASLLYGRVVQQVVSEEAPLWSRDGTELFCRQTLIATDRSTVIGIDVSTDSTPATWGEEQTFPIEGITVGSYRDYDITPDGKFLWSCPQTWTKPRNRRFTSS